MPEMDNRALKQVGVMGGTFSPIHMGHLMLAEWAREEAGLDQILFIPAGFPYMKKEIKLPDGEKRLEMVNLAISGRDDFLSSDMEIIRDGNTYTYETMELLKQEHPDTEYSFITGADCLYAMERWKQPERLFASCRIIAAARNGSPAEKLEEKCRELKERFHADILLLTFLSIEISSSDIRRRIQEGRSIRYLVPEKVMEYIKANHLYLDGNEEVL